MTDIFRLTNRPPADLFYRRDDPNDLRIGEIVSADPEDYEKAQIVILGCPQDEGVRRNRGRAGAAAAPDEIRKQFYKLASFGVTVRIFDLGDTIIQTTLEQTHEAQTAIVRQLLEDDKKIISLGGGNDIAYADVCALSESIGADKLLAFNIDQHFDVRADETRNSGTPYRQLLEEKRVKPENFYEIGYQQHANSEIYYEYLKNLDVNLMSLEEFREANDFGLLLLRKQEVPALFWGFDLDSVRASDAPGVSAPSPIGLIAEEFCDLAAVAGFQSGTRIVEFTEVNPDFDIDSRTTRLVAIAMHRFCAAASQL